MKKGQNLQKLKISVGWTWGSLKLEKNPWGPNMEASSSHVSAGQNSWRLMVPESELAMAKAPLERREGRHWKD